MLSCFTTNVLYANRTDTNMAMVMRALQESVHELIVSESNRVVATPTEKLARAQALFLYQVIRLFDGDITLRAQGEKDTALLHTWLGDLCRIREHLGDLAELENGATRSQPPKEWEVSAHHYSSRCLCLPQCGHQRWVFAESVRRTIVMAHSVMKVYEMMKGSDTKGRFIVAYPMDYYIQADRCVGDPGVWAYNHRWTLSRHLWEADSTYEFERMWKEKPQFIISNFSFARFLEHGRGEDVDEFAEILLSMYVRGQSLE